MSFNLASQITPDFSVTLKQGADRWVLACSGILDVPDAAKLVQPELLRLHTAALEAGVPVVRVEVKDVEYMNSSGLKSFMAWFLAAANAKEGRYVIEVGYDPERNWQQLSLRPMERLAPKTVRLVPAS